LNPARWALKGSADFGFEPRKAFIGKARAFDIALCFGLTLNLLRSPYRRGPNEIGEGQEFLAVVKQANIHNPQAPRGNAINARTFHLRARQQAHDTRAIQGWLGHRSITSTAIYTALAPNRFKDFWRE
jgi:integrase